MSALGRWTAGAGLAGAALIGVSVVMPRESDTARPARVEKAAVAIASYEAPMPAITRETAPTAKPEAATPETGELTTREPPTLAGAPDLTAPALIFDESDGKTEVQAHATPRHGAFKGGDTRTLAPAPPDSATAPE